MNDGTRRNRGQGPNGQPPHPATVVQPKAPHAATLERAKELPPHAATVVQPKAPHAARVLQPEASGVVQSRGYTNLQIDAFRTSNPRLGGESDSAFLSRLTELFKTEMQYGDRDDLRYLRKTMMGHRSLLVRDHGLTKTLDAHFNAHVLGNQAGVGWHSESTHADGDHGYSYTNWGWIAKSKGTYWGDQIIVDGTAKAGNNGVSSFYPATMPIADIRSEALYVANTNPQNGQFIIGRGKKTGIMIECLMNGNTITSAYPWRP